MKFTCEQKVLDSAMSMVIRGVPAHTTMDTLNNVRIKGADGLLTFESNSLDYGVVTTCEASVEQEGVIMVPARFFRDMVKKMPDGNVLIESTESRILISCGSVKFMLPLLDASSFPERNVQGDDIWLSVPQMQLRDMLSDVLPAVSIDNPNQMLGSVYFEVKNGQFRMIGLDGHRISMRMMPVEEAEERGAIVPGVPLASFTKILKKTDEAVDMICSKNHILFRSDDTEMWMRLADGSYFDVEQMIPKSKELSLSLNKQELTACVDRTLLMLVEGSRTPLVFDLKKDCVHVSLPSSVGEVDEDLEPVTYSGGEMRIGLNPRYLLDVLKTFPGEDVPVDFISPKSPIIIKDEERLNLLLPVNMR